MEIRLGFTYSFLMPKPTLQMEDKEGWWVLGCAVPHEGI